MRTLLHILLAAVVLGGLIGLSEPAYAQQKPVDVEVRVIKASRAGDHFDPKLADLRDKLQTAFGGFTHFTLADTSSFTLEPSQSKGVNLPGGTDAKVTFHGESEGFLKMGLGIGNKLNTTLRATRGSTFFQAGLPYKGGILILAIKVE